MSEMRGYAAAQREYENREPEQGGPYLCAECNGYGLIATLNAIGEDEEHACTECDGKGYIKENGEPCYSPERQAEERDAALCDRADMQRTEIDSGDLDCERQASRERQA